MAGLAGLVQQLTGIKPPESDLSRLIVALERIANAMEADLQMRQPAMPTVPAMPAAPSPESPEDPLDYGFVDPEQQAEFMEIEQRLRAARGGQVSDELILAEYERRHAGSDSAEEPR